MKVNIFFGKPREKDILFLPHNSMLHGKKNLLDAWSFNFCLFQLKNDFTLEKTNSKHFTVLNSLAHGLRLETAMNLSFIDKSFIVFLHHLK